MSEEQRQGDGWQQGRALKTACVLVSSEASGYKFEVAASFARVPCVGESIEAPAGDDNGDWPEDARGLKWRVVSVLWAVHDRTALPFLEVERASDKR